MSVQKLSDSSRSYTQANPFTQICNEIILNIKDNDAFRVYAYLQSKSQEWRVIKTHLQKICDVGSRKMTQIFSYLSRSNLIRYIRVIDDYGKVSRVDIQVLNGTEFNADTPFKPSNRQNPKLSTEKLSTPAETAAAGTHSCGNAPLLNKEKALKKERQNKPLVFEKQKTTHLGDHGGIVRPPTYPRTAPAVRPTATAVNHASSYVNHDTLSDEARHVERGSIETAERYLSNMKGIRLKRYYAR